MSDFFEKVLTALSRALDFINNGIAYSLKRIHKKKQMRNVQEKKSRIQQNLGELVYKLQTSGKTDISECEPMCAELLALDEKMNVLQKEFLRLEESKSPAHAPNAQLSASADTAVCTDSADDFDDTSA